MGTEPLLIDGYIRVSRVGGREGESFISPDEQRERIAAWAASRGVEIAEWHTDLDLTGGVLSRPGLDAMMERVRSGATGGVAVAYVDRLSRAGVADALRLVEDIHDAGGKFAALDLGIDPTTPFGEFGLTVLLALARMQRRRIAESWEVARERAVRRGVVVASTTPTGYRRTDDGRLEPDPTWAPIVRDLYERRATGASWAELARIANNHGLPVRYASGGHRGQGRWTGSTIARLMSGRVYLGESRHGAFVNPDAHEPLAPASIWHAAQAAKGAASSRPTSTPALLSGLVRCAGCGYGMWRGTGRGPNRSVQVSYRCRGGGSGGHCEDRAFAPAWALEALVIRAFLGRAADLAAIGTEPDDDLEAALADLAEAEHALAVFRDDPRVIGVLGADRFAEGLAERARMVDDAREDVEQARREHSGLPDLVTLRELWPGLTTVDRRRLLTAAVDCVVIAGKGPLTSNRVRVCWNGTGPSGLPGRGKRGVGVRPIELDGLPASTRVALAEDGDQHA